WLSPSYDKSNTYSNTLLVYINNHTSIWGSFWADGKWGYKCCRAFIKNSYCTGLAGIEAASSSNLLTSTPVQAQTEKKSLVEMHTENLRKGITKAKTDDDVNIHIKRKHIGEGDVQLDSKKLKKAIENEAKRHARLLQ